MKIMKILKFGGLAALVLSMAVGCAGQPTEPEVDPEQVKAEQMAAAQQAIADAKSALEEAKAIGAEWRDTEELIKQAEEALAAEDTAKAIELANQARRQAENAIAQKRAEEERLAAEAAAQAADDSYTVMRGDNLWNISGRSEIYGNPYNWPLIYKANRDKIQDADLIYPGQVFTIDRNASAAEMDAAARHARNRGAWSLGVTEESDRAYLSR